MRVYRIREGETAAEISARQGVPLSLIVKYNGVEELLPGDLLFFADGGDVHHVAMYLGEGRFVHSTGHTGTEGVILSSLAEEAPDYRADLKESMTAVASIFGAPQ